MSKGLSRTAFGEAIGANHDKIKNVETGKQRVDHEMLAALRRVFAVDLNELVAGPSDDGQSLPPQGGAQPDFIPIPRFDVRASAGYGSLINAEDAVGYYAYNRRFLKRRGLSPDMLAVIELRGDSMEPDLWDGDLMLINRAETVPMDGLIYAVRFGDNLFVKRIQALPSGDVQLLSSNPRYPPIPIAQGELDRASIIGRVVNSTHEW